MPVSGTGTFGRWMPEARVPQLRQALADHLLRRKNSTDQTASECRQVARQAILSTEKPPVRAPQAMKQPVGHARAQGRISDHMLTRRMRGPTTQDGSVPARVLHKAIRTIVIAHRQRKRGLNTVQEEARGLARRGESWSLSSQQSAFLQ